MLDITPAVSPAASKMEATSIAVTVLPAEPVMPIVRSSRLGFPASAWQTRASATRESLTSTWGNFHGHEPLDHNRLWRRARWPRGHVRGHLISCGQGYEQVTVAASPPIGRA